MVIMYNKDYDKLWTPEMDNILIENCNKCYYQELSEMLNMTRPQIAYRLKILGIKRDYQDVMAYKNRGKRKLNAEIIKDNRTDQEILLEAMTNFCKPS